MPLHHVDAPTSPLHFVYESVRSSSNAASRYRDSGGSFCKTLLLLPLPPRPSLGCSN